MTFFLWLHLRFFSLIGFHQLYYDLAWWSPLPNQCFLLSLLDLWVHSFHKIWHSSASVSSDTAFASLPVCALEALSRPESGAVAGLAVCSLSPREPLSETTVLSCPSLSLSHCFMCLFYTCCNQDTKFGPCYSKLTRRASQMLLILPGNTTLTHFKILAFV